jgi:DNA-binding ferritin-like protein
MKSLKHLQNLLQDLNTSGYQEVAKKLSKKAQEISAKDTAEALEEEAGKILKEEEQSKDGHCELIQNLLGHLKALQLATHSAHWISKGTPAYGDHLLFERLYGETSEEVDHVAEQFIPLQGVGEKLVNPVTITQITLNFLKKMNLKEDSKPEEIAATILTIESHFLETIQETYDTLKESKVLSMGADDLLMEMFRNHESHVYLLSQRLK